MAEPRPKQSRAVSQSQLEENLINQLNFQKASIGPRVRLLFAEPSPLDERILEKKKKNPGAQGFANKVNISYFTKTSVVWSRLVWTPKKLLRRKLQQNKKIKKIKEGSNQLYGASYAYYDCSQCSKLLYILQFSKNASNM